MNNMNKNDRKKKQVAISKAEIRKSAPTLLEWNRCGWCIFLGSFLLSSPHQQSPGTAKLLKPKI
jgi:hypothetical protein